MRSAMHSQSAQAFLSICVSAAVLQFSDLWGRQIKHVYRSIHSYYPPILDLTEVIIAV